MYDLVIKNGEIYDPGNDLHCRSDIGISGEKIRKIGRIKEEEGRAVIDAKGSYVLPGLIDHHAHVYFRGTDFSMPAETAEFPSGVTTVVDGGTTGISGYEAFYSHIVTQALIRIKSYLHVSSIGQTKDCTLENADSDKFDEEKILDMCSKYSRNIVGLKIKQNRPVVKEFGLKPLKRALEIAEKARLRLSVHASDSPGKTEEILEILRPGDIFCHVFHQQGETILDSRGNIRAGVWRAKEKGVLFEVAHGSMQFSGKVARMALSQGFVPDIVSSDLSLLAMYQVPNYSFSYVMSELLNLGMNFGEIVKNCTCVPAKLLGEAGLGAIAEGKAADLYVCSLVEKPVSYRDKYGNLYGGDRLICPKMTVKDGRIVYRAYDFF